jgi:outer membrane receptor protein involved in Fe transport
MNVQSRSLATAVYIACACGSAAAQTVIEEIVVTATKRGDVSVQEIPAGIKAVTGDFLEERDLRSFDDLARVEPSLQFAKAAIGDLQPVIRGIQSPGAGTVGVYFDETVITGVNFQDGGGRTPDIGTYDIQRVEILKGPQGTLFGASSMTGTVRLISNKPDAGRFDANVAARGNGLEDGDAGYGVDGMINVPVIDGVLALRAVGWHEHGGGYIDHFVGLNGVTEIEDADESDRSGGRIMARWTPNDRFTLDAFAMYQDIDVDGPPGYSDVPTGNMLPIAIVAGPPFVIGRVVPPLDGVAGERILTSPAQANNSSEVLMYGGTAEYDLGFGSVLATISKFENDPYYIEWDTTGIATRFFLLDPVPPTSPGIVIPEFGGLRLGVGTPWQIHQTQIRDVFSSEIRFSSDFEGPLNFVTGFFYQDDESKTDLVVMRADPVAGTTLCTDWPSCVADPTGPAAQSLVFGTDQRFDNESFAIFGHFDYELSDALTAGGGVRYYESDERDMNFTTQAFQGSIPPVIPPSFGGPVQTVPVLGLDDKSTVSEVTWDASLAWEFDDTRLYYFRAAKGFRQGGINDSNSAAQLGAEIPGSFEPDTVLSLEVGAKSTWFDERLTANATYFKMFWDDIQVPGQDPTGSINFIDNAAEAEIDGFELELAARPSDQWYLTFGLTWLDAQLTEDQDVSDPLGLGFPGGLDGDDVPKVPEWAFSGSAEYRFPFQMIADVDTVLRANFSYTGDSTRFFNDSFENNFEIGDYFLMNLSASFAYRNWEFRIIARNVTDEAAVIDYFGNGADPQQIVSVEPRALGAQLRWRFQ